LRARRILRLACKGIVGQVEGLSKMTDGEVVVHERSLAKGLLAGLIGGLAATAAKTLAEKVYPPRTHGEPEPPEVFAEKIAGRELRPIEKTAAAETIHWGFGAAAGAAYGALAEFFPAATDKDGASFGLALATLTHEGALPAMELSAPAEEQSPREHTSEMATHLVFGVVTETVRRFVRRLL
jgi:putative membrane protein